MQNATREIKKIKKKSVKLIEEFLVVLREKDAISWNGSSIDEIHYELFL